MNRKIRFIIELSVIGIIVLLINTFLFQLCFVRGESMVPTYKDGQVLVAKKFNLNVNNNDIVVIKKDKKIIIKRVIGIPGDKISVSNGYVFVNDNKFDDRYTQNAGILENDITLGDNQYFVMGDNRNVSNDSRFDEIGIINENEIIGLII